MTQSLIDPGPGTTATLPAPHERAPRPHSPAGSYADIAEQVAECADGEPMILLGRQAQMNRRTGEFSDFGITYALGRLAGNKPAAIDPEGTEVVFPTSRFTLLSRFSMRGVGDFSSLKLHKDRLGANQVLGARVSLDDMYRHRSLRAVLGLSTSDLGGQGNGLSEVELAEVKKPAVELAIGTEEAAKLIKDLTQPGNPAAPYFEQDFSLLKAMLGDEAI